MKKFVILDRDGVINADSDAYIKSPDEWHPLPGSLEAIALLNRKGYQVAVATNQSGLARGYFSVEMLEAIHAKMHQMLEDVGGKIEAVFYCPHNPSDNCLCRKPQPGLLHQIAAQYALDLSEIPFVGDSMRDLEAANAANARPILVLSGNGKKTLQKHYATLKTIDYYDDLYTFAKTLPLR